MPPLRRLSSTALLAGIVARILLPGGIGLLGRGLAQNGNDSTKIVPLDLNLRLWDVNIHTSVTDLDYSGQEAAVERS